MQKNIFITGCSSGLGLALAQLYLKKSYKVYGTARRMPKITDKNFIFERCDLKDTKSISQTLSSFIQKEKKWECVYLNAGILGKVDFLDKLTLNDFEEVMNVNVYSNKVLLDIFSNLEVKTIIATSSGASINALLGWSSYCMSKTSLNMLMALYALENKECKVLALAPGIVDTDIRASILKLDDEKFPSAKIIKNSLAFSKEEAALKFDDVLQNANKYESGSFLDVREI